MILQNKRKKLNKTYRQAELVEAGFDKLSLTVD
jgi:hypothetical protein